LIVLVPRLAALPCPVDLAVGLTWTVAGWANVLSWYITHPWVDIPVHATTPGATAAAVYLLLARTGLAADLQDDDVRRSAVIVLTTSVGTTLAVWWEFYEWIVYRDEGPPQVGYGDTLLDLLLGTLSSAVAGLGLALWSAAGRRLTRQVGGAWGWSGSNQQHDGARVDDRDRYALETDPAPFPRHQPGSRRGGHQQGPAEQDEAGRASVAVQRPLEGGDVSQGDHTVFALCDLVCGALRDRISALPAVVAPEHS
jgi:hypothetical protein